MLGLNIINTASNIKVYPNPTNSVVNIESPLSVDIRLTTIDGKIVIDSKNVNVVNLSYLPNGVYLLGIFDGATGLKIKTERITKIGD